MQKKKDTLEKKKCYTYMVRCSDHSLYQGWTKSRRPVTLVYYEVFEAKQDAMRREYAIKQLTKKEKEKLVAYHHLSSIAT